MGWDPRTQQAPARRSRAKIAGIGIAVAAAVAAAATAAVILLGGHHNNTSGLVAPPSHTSSASSSAPSTSPSSSTSSATAPPSSTSSSQSPTTSTSTSPPVPASGAKAQATAVSNLLVTGSASSDQLSQAVDNVQNCTDVPSSTATIQAVRDQRQGEFNRAQALATDALPNGAGLKSDLTNALSFSLKADDDYLQWAQQQSADCQAGNQSAAAMTAGGQAAKYKTQFVGLWNPVANTYGLPATTVANI
jgi:hypothetical protein